MAAKTKTKNSGKTAAATVQDKRPATPSTHSNIVPTLALLGKEPPSRGQALKHQQRYFINDNVALLFQGRKFAGLFMDVSLIQKFLISD